jgi:hypothetical protein
LLTFKSNMHQYLRHRDPSLDKRIQAYASAIETGRGLWGTDPPKPLADLTESILGAVHLHGGFLAGQKAALHVLKPVLDRLATDESDPLQLMRFRHPKKLLHERCGQLVTLVTTLDDGRHLENASDTDPSSTDAFRDPSTFAVDGQQRFVTSVMCHGECLLSVNRAAHVFLTMLDQNTELAARLKSAQARVDGGLSQDGGKRGGKKKRMTTKPNPNKKDETS